MTNDVFKNEILIIVAITMLYVLFYICTVSNETWEHHFPESFFYGVFAKIV